MNFNTRQKDPSGLRGFPLIRAFLASCALLLTVTAQSTSALERTTDPCVAACAEVLRFNMGYQVKVRDLDGSVRFYETVRFAQAVDGSAAKGPQTIAFANGLDLSKSGSTTTSVINTPLPGGGSIITITVYQGIGYSGPIISNTLIRISPTGQVLEITDLMMER